MSLRMSITAPILYKLNTKYFHCNVQPLPYFEPEKNCLINECNVWRQLLHTEATFSILTGKKTQKVLNGVWICTMCLVYLYKSYECRICRKGPKILVSSVLVSVCSLLVVQVVLNNHIRAGVWLHAGKEQNRQNALAEMQSWNPLTIVWQFSFLLFFIIFLPSYDICRDKPNVVWT